MLHGGGADGKDIAIRTTIFIDERRVTLAQRERDGARQFQLSMKSGAVFRRQDKLQRLMPWIKVIDEAEATGTLKEIYESQATKAGALANILKIHSLAPETLFTHMAFYQAIMHAPGDLSRAQREMIAVVVSSLNRCHY